MGQWFTQSYLFKERLLKCEPIDLVRFVVDLWKRQLDYWTPDTDMHPQERNSKRSTYHHRCALLTKRALVTHSPYTLTRYMLLDLPRDVIRSVARFRLQAHTLRIESVTSTHNTSTSHDLGNANDVQDEQYVLFHCTHPHVVSLKGSCVPVSYCRLQQSVCFFGQENSELYFFLHALLPASLP